MKKEDIKDLMESFENSSLTTFKLKKAEFSLELRKQESGYAAIPVLNEKIQTQVNQIEAKENLAALPVENKTKQKEEADNNHIVKAQLVGVFYCAPSPESAPFVSLNQKVKKGDVLGIIEAMKMMNEIICQVDGTIVSISAENENLLEFGQEIMQIKPD